MFAGKPVQKAGEMIGPGYRFYIIGDAGLSCPINSPTLRNRHQCLESLLGGQRKTTNKILTLKNRVLAFAFVSQVG